MGEPRVVGRVRVEERAGGGRVWIAEYKTADGSRTRKVLGPAWVRDSGKRTPRGAVVWRAGAGSKPDARYLAPRDADDRLRELLEAERRRPATAVRTRGKTWGDAAKAWLDRAERVGDVAPTTLRNYQSMVKRLRSEGLADDLPLRQVTTKRLEGVQHRLLTVPTPDKVDAEGKVLRKGKVRSRKTVHNRLLAINGVLEHAVREGWIGENPMNGADVISAPRPGPEFRVLEPSQVEAVCRAILQPAEDEIPRKRGGGVHEHHLRLTRDARAMWAEAIRVAAYTGLRLGELRVLRWRHVDFVGQTLRPTSNLPTSSPAGAPEKAPKSGVGRGLPLIPQAAAALERASKLGPGGPDDLVFVNTKGGMLDASKVRDAFYEGLQRAGLGHMRTGEDPMVFHDLRHTFGTIAVRVFPVTDVQAYMGHANIETTMRYVHHVPRNDAADKLGAAFGADLGAPVADPRPAVRAGG